MSRYERKNCYVISKAKFMLVANDNCVSLFMQIAPHSLLQAIMKRSVDESVTNVGLLKAKEENEHEYLLNSIGKLYQVIF